MRTYQTYEHLCTVNKYLIGQMEECTPMIRMLESQGLDASYWRNKFTRMRSRLYENLSDFETIYSIHEMENKKI
ncbi:hypothetical protein FKG96_12335 [Olivibacter sp. LS-1]|uniref:hypothetical protein n=1 Tax=Olivibacter sp. LS-1 TaxID=2592345 RepID=UPI0011EA82B6|nr:hypothetical protein [Olivibacter sp. LS-1]QEL01560.1 hypothetical protein FKG96_12335 [Olivibacter sp. LS-1]